MTDQPGKGEGGSSNWLWWTLGVFLLLAYCNYSDRDERPESANATAGMSYGEISEYRKCMDSSRGYNVSDYVKSDMCRKSALGYGTGSNCRVEWDGHANAVVCD